MTAELISEEKNKLEATVLKALEDFTRQTSLTVEEMKIITKEFSSDSGKIIIYNSLSFKVTV